MIQRCGRLHDRLNELFAAIDLVHRSDGKAFGEDQVAPAGQHMVAEFHFFLGHDLIDHKFARRLALEHSLEARLFHNGSHAAVLVIDEKHL